MPRKGTGGSNPPCSVIKTQSVFILKFYFVKLHGYILQGIRTVALLLEIQGESLVGENSVQDVPGSAEAGVKGANTMFATGTPNPPCSVIIIKN